MGASSLMEPREGTPRVVRFGIFELDRRSGELRKDGLRVRLQEQPLRILDALLAEPGEPVTREALRQRLWPDDTFVDFDTGLNRAINRLRTALGDDAENPRFIETLERRGYRFITPVTAVDLPPPPTPAEALSAGGPVRPRAWRLRAAAAAVALLIAVAAGLAIRRGGDAERAAIRSLAVLPLANLTGDPAQEYFSDGMTDALITNLASLPALRVTSRQSVMRYKQSAMSLPQIARELGVEGVVEGSVMRSGGRVRITAQLVHASSDRHLWARSYERPLEDVLALQGEISRAIAEEVRLTLSTRESQRLTPTRAVKPEAYDAYLLGRHHWDQRSPESLERALAYFQSAVDKDPDFAQAHAGLALALGPQAIFGYTPPGQGLAKQKSAALRALELDPTLAEARTALAAFHAREWNWTEAEEEYRRAVEIDPNSAVGHVRYGWYLHALGRFAESLAHRKRALELDPLNVAVNRGLARDLEATGDPEKAAAQWQRVLELEPAQVPHHLSLSLLQFELGHTDEALRSLERARAMGPFDPPSLAHLAVVEAASGNAPEARRRLLQLRAESGRYVSPVLVALVHASLGETDETFALLEKAYTAKDPLLIRIQVGEAGLSLRLPKRQLAALRSDPRFSDLVRRMGLPPLTPAAGSH